MKKGKTLMLLLGGLGGALAGSTMVFGTMKKLVTQKEKKYNKFKTYYEVTNQWLILKNEGKSLEEYFLNNNYKTMAIYGMGELGNRLYEELSKSDNVKIKYAIDENAGSVYSDLEILSMDDKLESVDVVVVTAMFAFDDIQDELSKKIYCPIVSLEDVVYEV